MDGIAEGEGLGIKDGEEDGTGVVGSAVGAGDGIKVG